MTMKVPPPPLVQALPKAQKTTVSPGSGAWTRPVTARGTPGRELFSTRDVSHRPQGVSGTKARNVSSEKKKKKNEQEVDIIWG